jgi:ElaB/YqjD/DUF883 family membrane-anchored ribosome-binding protein
MNAHKLARATQEATAGLSEITNRLRDLSEAVADRCKDTYHDAGRGVRKLRIAGEEGIHHTRRHIKHHPLAAVAVAASSAFLLGGLAGWMSGRGRRR